MWSTLADGFSYLGSHSWVGLFASFWFSILFDVPRYTFAFVAAALFRARPDSLPRSVINGRNVSVVVAGHNEANGIERCVRSFHEQSRPPDEIIVVSDGSTDGMSKKLRELQRNGLVDQVHCTTLRGGKSAACNLGNRWSTGDIVVNADCDCTYDRHALKHILEPFGDPSIGAVSGNILVRNASQSLFTTFQAIEYLVSISLGRQAAGLTDQVTCVSGAFGAFRRAAINDVHGFDVGSGEDFDLTLKLRKAGWNVAFAPDAICYTGTPTTLRALVRQRFRWERDAIRLRYRKHADLLNPFSSNFHLKELLHEVEFFVFNVLGALIFPVYLIWLFLTYGDFAVAILLAVQAGLIALDVASFMLAARATPKAKTLSLLPHIAGYSFFNSLVMRHVRLAAYLQEWILNASARDEFLPAKVSLTRRW